MTNQGSSKWTPDQPHSAGPNNEATQQFGAVPQQQYQQQPYGQQYPQPPYGQQYPAGYQQPEKRGGPNTWLLCSLHSCSPRSLAYSRFWEAPGRLRASASR